MKFKTLIFGISLITGLALTNAHAEDSSSKVYLDYDECLNRVNGH